EVRYDPEQLDRIEIYIDGTFRQRAKRLQIKPHRAPRELLPIEAALVPKEPTDYLGYLTQKKQADISDIAKSSSKAASNAFSNILKKRIAPQVFDRAAAEAFYQTYGPFDTGQLKQCLDTLLCTLPSNLHLSVYLQHIKDRLIGG
ncbi:hypothetical protein ACFLZM_07825, partial [Thermodesulfobacteriota bacterium]